MISPTKSWLNRLRGSIPSRRTKSSAYRHVEVLETRELLSIQPLTTVDQALNGDTADGLSGAPSVSADGNIIVFQSQAGNLLAGVNVPGQIYAYNRTTDILTLVSAKPDGSPSQYGGASPVVSLDGKFVLFTSRSKDLVSQDLGTDLNLDQLFVRDLVHGTTTLVSASLSGLSGANADSGQDSSSSFRPPLYAISSNNRYVAFWSQATNLTAIAPTSSNLNQLYVRDLQTGSTRLASTDSSGNPAGPSNVLANPFTSIAVSDQGAVLFTTNLDFLVNSDNLSQSDVFLNDGTTHLVSLNSAGTAPANNDSLNPRWDATRTKVYFLSRATDLGFGGSGITQLYVRNLQTNTVTLVSHAPGNSSQPGSDEVRNYSISSDGRYVALESVTSLGSTNVYLLDTVAGTSTLVSAIAGTSNPANNSGMPVISGDGSTIVFKSGASNLISGFVDNNQFGSDFYAYTRSTGAIRLLTSDRITPLKGGDGNEIFSASFPVAVSSDGSSIAFQSLSTNLVANDNNLVADVFLVEGSTRTLLSRRDPANSIATLAGGYTTGSSADGRYVLIVSPGANISLSAPAMLYIKDTQTGDLIQVNEGRSVTIADAAISPDGRYVVFSDGAVKLFDRVNHTLEVISKKPDGTSSSGSFFRNVALSADGRYVAFVGNATDLIAGLSDPNGAQVDLYLRDRQLGTTILVNRLAGSATTTSNRGFGSRLLMSADGQKIVYDSTASDLAPNDTNGTGGSDIFVFNLAMQSNSLVTVTTAGAAAGGRDFSISSDGTKIAFASSGSNIVAGVTGSHVYLRNLSTATTTLIDKKYDGSAPSNSISKLPKITPDGKYVVFESSSTDLVQNFGAANSSGDLYRTDLTSGVTSLVTPAATGTGGGNANSRLDDLNGESRQLISPNGRYVVFDSFATNLVANFVDGNGDSQPDLFERDLLTGKTWLVSQSLSGSGGNNASGLNLYNLPDSATVLDDGRVIFFSLASNLTTTVDDNQIYDVFLADPAAVSGASIRGKVFDDYNSDGIQQSNEPILAGATLYCDANANGHLDTGERSVQSGVDGAYSFTGLAVGNYRVRLATTAVDQLIAPASGYYDVSLANSSQVVTGRDFADHVKHADLAVSNITFPASAAMGSAITFHWTVTNQGQGPTNTSSWRDSVYISESPTLDANALLLGVADHTGSLNAGGSYVGSFTTTVPAAIPGPFYIIIQTDHFRVVKEVNRDNNILTAIQTLQTTVTPLDLDTPYSGTFPAANPVAGKLFQYFITFVPQLGPTAQIRLHTSASTGDFDLFVSANSPPTDQMFDATVHGTAGHDLVLPLTGSGIIYIAVAANLPASANRAFTLTAETVSLSVTSTDVSSLDRGGTTTFLVTGSRFDGEMAAALVNAGGQSFTALHVDPISSAQMYVTFDLRNIPEGVYDFRVSGSYFTLDTVQISGEGHYRLRRQTFSATLTKAFTVTAAKSDDVSLSISAPATRRIGVPFTAYVSIVNNSTHDVPAPVLIVSADQGSKFSLSGDPSLSGSMIFQALGSGAGSGILRAGEELRVQIRVAAGGDGPLQLSVGFAHDDATPIDWTSFLADLGVDTSDPVWNTVRQRFVSHFGTTWKQVETALAADLTIAGSRGGIARTITEPLSAWVTNAYYAALNPVPPAAETIPVAPLADFESISPTINILGKDYRDLTLEEKEEFLSSDVANWLFAIMGNGVAQNHMNLFLGPQGINSGYHPSEPFYGDGSPVSNAAADARYGDLSFPPLNDGPYIFFTGQPFHSFKELIQQKIDNIVRQLNGAEPPLTEWKDFTRYNVAYLIFYETETTGLNGLGKLLGGAAQGRLDIPNPYQPSKGGLGQRVKMTLDPILGGDKTAFDLYFGFGEMDDPNDSDHFFQFKVKITDFERQGDVVNYKAEITYHFDDFYDFTNGHVDNYLASIQSGSLLGAIKSKDPGALAVLLAYDIKTAGWGTAFADAIEIKKTVSSTVNLKQDPKPPPPDPPVETVTIQAVRSFDPNDIIGPGGYGVPQFRAEQPEVYPYTVHFENSPDLATAPAQQVVVTQQLDADLDWSTFELGSVGFGDQIIVIPQGIQAWSDRILYHNQDGSDLYVDFSARLNPETGVVAWTFRSVDPDTGLLPEGVFDGFLPVNDDTGRGQGYINYDIKPKAGLATGTPINAQASIVFDANSPIATNIALNTIDAGKPTSHVNALAAISRSLSFPVSWTGSDDAGGSGIDTYNVYVSDNNAPYTLWQSGTSLTTASFTGVEGHTYRFYSVATDHVGHLQSTPVTPQATTKIDLIHPPVLAGAGTPTYAKNQSPVAVLSTVTVADADDNLGGGTLSLTLNDLAIGKKQVRPDQLNTAGLANLGTVANPQFTNGQLIVTVQLKSAVTAAQVQASLRNVTFTTSGKGLKTSTRNLTAQATDGDNATSNLLTETINVLKKAPKSTPAIAPLSGHKSNGKHSLYARKGNSHAEKPGKTGQKGLFTGGSSFAASQALLDELFAADPNIGF
ncbi:MAG: CARDB domain-containing protein [Planctomycetales bacterium]